MPPHTPPPLGRLLQEHRKSWVPPIALLAVFAIPAGLAIDAGFSSHDPGILLMGFGFLLPFFISLADCWVSRVRLHERGLSRKNLFGTKSVYFEPQTRIWISAAPDRITGQTQTTRIKIDDGRKALALRGRGELFKSLHDAIVRAELQHIGPALKRAYAEGKAVNFSALEIAGTQLRYRSKKIDAANIARAGMAHGRLTFWEAGKRLPACSIQTARIANLHVFLTLLPALASLDEGAVV